MTSLAQDKNTSRRDGVTIGIPVIANDCIYGGSNICINAAGYALPGSDAAGLIYQGVANNRADNIGGANGKINVEVRRRGLFLMEFQTAISLANAGDNVFLVDDQLVDIAANVTNLIFCGIIAEYVDSTHAWVDIEPAILQADVATHIADGSGAHAGSAISIADAGAHFAAAEANMEAALQKLAKTIPLNFSAQTIATAAADAKIAEDFELPVAVRIKRAYATLSTAPGAGKTLTIEINGVTTLVAIADTATKGEDEALDIAIAANTDFDITLTQDTGAAAGLNLMLIAQVDDGE